MITSPAAPEGDVTLMFTDIEGSTRAWQTHGDLFHPVLARHNALLREAIQRHGGYEVKTIGDAFMVAFADPLSAALCALDMQRLLEAADFSDVGSLRVRIGLHTGELQPLDGDYYGNPVNRAARIEGAAHGGQILLSEDTAQRVQSRLPPNAVLTEQGLHRLKDLSEPQRLTLLTHPDLPQRAYPPLNTLNLAPHNFPAQATTFIGREDSIADLIALLADPRRRLITLTGPGGTGKTRLSLQVGAECVMQYKQGVWLVELAGVSRAQDVPAAVALALGVPLSSEGEARAQVTAFLRERQCLLVLDNFEQVIDAARFVADLLKQCPHVTILISSRELLQIAGEHEFALLPLDVPPEAVDAHTWTQYPSMRLFVERCQAARANFEITPDNVGDVAQICRHLEGLPLALELTAALARGLTPAQIVPRLQDRFRLLASARRDLDPRQRSLRGAIDWSYDLLSEDERALFGELSVFAGGCGVEAVEAVCETPGAFDLVFALRDKSLIRSIESEGAMRFTMLELLREYAREKLGEQGGEENALDRHAAYYLTVAQAWSPKLLQSEAEAKEARLLLTTDLDNLRAGMDRAIARPDMPATIAYGEELSRFLLNRGLFDECVWRLDAAERAARQSENYAGLARLLNRHGIIHLNRSEYDPARACFQECCDLSRQQADAKWTLMALANLGNIAWSCSDYAEARRVWQDALPIAKAANDLTRAAVLHNHLGVLASDEGRYEEAVAHFADSLKLHKQNHYDEGVAFTLAASSEPWRRQREYDRALELLRESNRIFVEQGNKHAAAQVMVTIGLNLLEDGQPDQAEAILQESLAMGREMGVRYVQMQALYVMGRVAATRDQFDKSHDLFRLSCEIAFELKDRRHTAQVLHHGGLARHRSQALSEAYLLLGVAAREYTALGVIDAGEALYQQQITGNLLEAEEEEQLERQMQQMSALDAAAYL